MPLQEGGGGFQPGNDASHDNHRDHAVVEPFCLNDLLRSGRHTFMKLVDGCQASAAGSRNPAA